MYVDTIQNTNTTIVGIETLQLYFESEKIFFFLIHASFENASGLIQDTLFAKLLSATKVLFKKL
jgi:hypothetical protein